MLEEPLLRSPSYFAGRSPSLVEDHFLRSPGFLRPAVDVTEEGDTYVVEAELPGVKKENLAVSVHENGRAITIEGKVQSRRPDIQQALSDSKDANTDATSISPDASTGEYYNCISKWTPINSFNAGTTVINGADQSSSAISTERSFAGSATFSRTVWLPRPADPAGVTAQLLDGVLTVRIPRAEDKAAVKISVA
jgi:HSP20 family molecular chaperone IbpA